MTEIQILENQIAEYTKERRKAYQREYRRKHPDKVKQWRQNYLMNCYRRMIEQQQAQ